MADRDVPYHAEWAENIGYRKDPNRIRELMPTSQSTEAAASIESSPPYSTAADAGGSEPSYYDISMLKAPVWGWEIASYFYLGGISAGSYLMGHVASLAEKRRFNDLERVSTYLSILSLLPCPLLLIHDLGDPKRFHHMLRVWKPSTPMNLGTWCLVAYSGVATRDAVLQILSDHGNKLTHGRPQKLLAFANSGPILFLRNLTGIPLALMIVSYTGVLLSCTANPLWCQNPWLSPLFTASAISSGAQAISLLLDLTSPSDESLTSSQTALQHIGTMSKVAEGLALAGFNKYAGERAAVLQTGNQSAIHQFAIGATIASAILNVLLVPKAVRKPIRIVASILGLAGAFAMRWTMVHGGRDAANDPRTARLVSKRPT